MSRKVWSVTINLLAGISALVLSFIFLLASGWCQGNCREDYITVALMFLITVIIFTCTYRLSQNTGRKALFVLTGTYLFTAAGMLYLSGGTYEGLEILFFVIPVLLTIFAGAMAYRYEK